VARRLSVLLEYKVAYARPLIDVPAGEGWTTAIIQQVAFGLAFAIK